MARRDKATEVASVFAGIALTTWLVSQAPEPLARHGHLVIAAVFLVTALRMARRDPGGPEGMGIALAGLLSAPEAEDTGSWRELLRTLKAALPVALRELGWALAVAVLVFPPYAVLFAIWHDAPGPFHLELPDDPVDFALGQLVVVALPEEVLFRGYFQTRLSQIFPRTRRVLGAELSPVAWLLQALMFGVVHLFTGGVGRLSTVAPGLLFGWLRARRGGIGAAVFLHALSNLCAEILARGLW